MQAKLPTLPRYALPVLGDLPLVGPALFRQHPLVYGAMALTAGLAWFLYRSRAGLVLRSVGESPESAHALGYPVRRIRLAAVVAGGALCGLAGAYISTVYTPLWVEGMVAGRGWIALALTTFATWRPARVLLGAYLFGGVTMLQFHLQATGVQVASQLPEHAALRGHHRGAGADLAQSGLDPREHAGLAGQAVPSRGLTGAPRRAIIAVSKRFRFLLSPVSPGRTFDMTDLHKRSLMKAAALSALAAAALAGCGKKDEPAPAQAPASAPAASAPAAKAEPLKIAFAYVGPVGDGGWSFAHDNGRKAIEKEFGDKVVTSFVESVPESADAERVLRDMAGQGNKLIFGTTFGYMETIQKIAPDFPDVKFEHATGYKTAPNVRTYDSRTYEGAYMAGVIAGAMTKSNTLGVVGSVPIPEVIRNINSFTLGAQSVNPNVKTKVVWVNEWFSPPKETEAATSLINGGADVLFQNTDSPAVLKTAQEKGKRAFGWDSDMTAYGPKAHLGSAVINWGPYYVKATRDVLEGKWTTGQSWWGVKEGAIDLVSIADDVPAETRAKVDQVKAGLKDGSFAIWKGPILGQDGKELLAKDVVADDKFLSGINFYVKGVEGTVPGGDKK